MSETRYPPQWEPLPVSDPVGKMEQWMRLKGRSETSIKQYVFVCERFRRTVGQKKVYTTDDVEQFMNYLLQAEKTSGHMDVPERKASFLRFTHYILKRFFKANKWEWYDEDEEELPKLNRPRRPFYHYDEIEKIVAAAQQGGNLRDYVGLRLINLAFSRRRSWVLLQRWDFDPTHGTIKMPVIKGGRQLTLTLDKETNEALLKYLSTRTDPYPALLPSYRPRNPKGAMAPNYINTLVKKYCEAAGVENKGVHAFRRGMVTYLFDQGYREREIFEMGDWTSEDMVREYVQLAPSYASTGREQGHPFFAGQRPSRRVKMDEGKEESPRERRRRLSRPSPRDLSDPEA